MRTMKNLFSKIRRNVRKSYIIAGLVIGLLGVGGMVAHAEFYPDRTPFDYNKPCNPNDNDPYDRCGSLTGPVFNSFINTPSYGDERAFFDARRSDQTAAGSFKNVLPDVTDGSKEVVLRTYIHNNANQSMNDAAHGFKSVAKNTQVRVLLPTATGNSLRARSYISASNATPNLVEDTVDLISSKDFRVEYIPNSAVLYNNGPFKNGIQLNNSVVTTGAPIGYNALNGDFPGCFDFEAVVQIRVKVIPKEIPNVSFTKQVAVPGQATWGEKVNVKPGDDVKWLVSFGNKGTTNLTNVDISDKLPPHLQVVHGSVKWIYAGTNGQTQEVAQNDTQFFTTGGINFGTWKPNGGFYVKFETTAKDDFDGCSVNLRNISYNDTDQTPKIEDSADVTITKPNCKPNQPTFSCDLLTSQLVSDKTFRFTTKATAKDGATISRYFYDFGDNTEPLTTDKTVVDHSYGKPGDYVSVVKVEVKVGDQTKTAESESCKVVVHIPTPPTTPPSTPPSTTLTNTGAGDVLGIFAATTVAGAFFHRMYAVRRSRV